MGVTLYFYLSFKSYAIFCNKRILTAYMQYNISCSYFYQAVIGKKLPIGNSRYNNFKPYWKVSTLNKTEANKAEFWANIVFKPLQHDYPNNARVNCSLCQGAN